MNIKKYSRWFLLLVILLASSKAIIFTGELILADFFFYNNNKEKAPVYLYRIISAKPIVYRSLPNAQKNLVEDFIVKKAIYARYRSYKNIFDNFSGAQTHGLKELSIDHFKTLYRDNFYLQYLFPPPLPQPNWQNLDPIALELLANKTLNPLTISLWERIKPQVTPGFTANLADYCLWQENLELANYLGKKAAPSVNGKTFFDPGSPTASESFHLLRATLMKKNKLTDPLTLEDLEANPAVSEDFNDTETFKMNWEFSLITGNKERHVASFTMGLAGDEGNRCLVIMGFDNGSGNDPTDPTKTTARGGAVRREKIPITRGYYLLSFDYLTATGLEKPSLFLDKGISEVFLPPTQGTWKKAVYFLNNTLDSRGVHSVIKPIFRMWGTGTVLIDNVYFAAVTKSTFSFTRKTLFYTVAGK